MYKKFCFCSFCALFLLVSRCLAQSTNFAPCFFVHYSYSYFTFGAKYQVSSESLVIQANKFLGAVPDTVDGYITVSFWVNCKGEKGKYQLLETDANYQETKFGRVLTDKILEFTKVVDVWKRVVKKGQGWDYQAYISYKFTDGKITEIIP